MIIKDRKMDVIIILSQVLCSLVMPLGLPINKQLSTCLRLIIFWNSELEVQCR